MKFLSKLGKILLTGTQIVTGLAPLFPQQGTVINKIEDTITKIASLVAQVEAFGTVLGIAGADKLRALIPSATQILLQSDLLIGRKIKDATLFAKGVTSVVSGIADILNSLDDDIKTEDVVK